MNGRSEACSIKLGLRRVMYVKEDHLILTKFDMIIIKDIIRRKKMIM